jgi:hypothetical protein
MIPLMLHSPNRASDACTAASITVVVPTNGRDLESLDRAVDSANRLAGPVIIVTQADRETAEAILRRVEGRARVIRDDQRGLSRARNIGLAAVVSEWVLFLDDDAELIDDFRDVVAELGALKGVAVVTWRIRSAEGVDISRFRDQSCALSAWNFWKLSREHGALWRVADLKALNGFDDRFGLGRWAGSDEGADLMVRLLSSGRHGRYLARHASIHPAGGDGYVLRARAYGRGTGRLIRRHLMNPRVWPYAIHSVLGLGSVILPRRFLQSERRAKPLRALGIVEGVVIPERLTRRG